MVNSAADLTHAARPGIHCSHTQVMTFGFLRNRPVEVLIQRVIVAQSVAERDFIGTAEAWAQFAIRGQAQAIACAAEMLADRRNESNRAQGAEDPK